MKKAGCKKANRKCRCKYRALDLSHPLPLEDITHPLLSQVSFISSTSARSERINFGPKIEKQ